MNRITDDLFLTALTPKWKTLDEVRQRMRKLLGRNTQITRFEAIPLANQVLEFGFAESRTRDGIVYYQITALGQRRKNRLRRWAKRYKQRA